MNEDENNRPYDWQDKVIITAGWICVVVLIGLMLYGR